MMRAACVDDASRLGHLGSYLGHLGPHLCHLGPHLGHLCVRPAQPWNWNAQIAILQLKCNLRPLVPQSPKMILMGKWWTATVREPLKSGPKLKLAKQCRLHLQSLFFYSWVWLALEKISISSLLTRWAQSLLTANCLHEYKLNQMCTRTDN